MPTILLAIDAFSPLYQLLPAAVFLASRRNAELMCVFTQDSRVLPGVALPCTYEIGAHSAVCYPVTSRSIEKRMSGIAEEMRRRLSREAERQHLRWGFQQRSGSISQIATETDAEIVVPGWGESQWASSMRSCVATHWTPDRLIMAVVDESSAASPQVVEAARSLLGPNGLKRLIILSLQRDDNNASEQLRKSCDQSSGEARIAVASVEKLIQHLRLLRPTLVLLGRDHPLSADVRLQKTLTSVKCPMALIRTTPSPSSRTDRLA